MKLSFVLPSFNDPRIVEAIASIHALEAPDKSVEIIVQDGGSKSELLKKIKSVLTHNDRLIVQSDDGIFDGINKGLSNATGDMIATLGSDDRVVELDFDYLVGLHKSGHNFIQFDIEYTDALWKPIRYWRARKLSFFNYFIGRQYAHFGLICSKDVYEQIGYFNTSNKINADYEFFYECILNRSILQEAVVNKTFVQMKIGGNSSAGIKAVLKGNIRLMQFMVRKNPLLLLGLALKPFHKTVEYYKAGRVA
jgi:glycosyltransferase involved in cell wall biosynthesis